MLSADLVKKKAIETGFDLVGITDAKPMRELTTLLEERQLQGKEPEFVSDSIEKRLEPKFFFPKAKSIVMTAVNYYYSAACNESFRSKLSRSAWGLGSRRVMGGMLEQLGQSLQELEPELQYRDFCGYRALGGKRIGSPGRAWLDRQERCPYYSPIRFLGISWGDGC